MSNIIWTGREHRSDGDHVKVLILADLLRDTLDDLFLEGVDQPLFDEVPVDDQADLPHGGWFLKMADQLLLAAGKVSRGQLGKDRNPIIELDHPAQGLEAAGFIVEMTAFSAGLSQLAEPDDLGPETMPLFQ